MPIEMQMTLHDGNCPAGTVNDAVVKFLETSMRTNAGGWRMNLEAESIGKYAKLVTPIPWITWCSYRVTIKSAPGNWALKTITYEFDGLENDKDFETTLKPRLQNLVMREEAPTAAAATITTTQPPPPTGTVECPTCGQPWTLPPPPPPTPPGPDRLLAIYKENGMPVPDVPWVAGSESGVTNSSGEVRISNTGPVSLTIVGDVIGEFVNDEKVVIDVSDYDTM